MVTNKLLLSLIVIGLVTGCTAETSFQGEAEATLTPKSIPSPLATQTGDSEPPPATETSEMPTNAAVPDTPFPVESEQPPDSERRSPRPPVEGARRDLARRLQVDLALVEVIEAVTQEPDVEMMPCLANGTVTEELWVNLDEVQWITLSVKKQVHHYLVLDDFIVYCQM